MPSKLPRVRTAILAGLAALTLGGVAVAAEGLSPASAERATKAASGGQAAAFGHGQSAASVGGPDAGGAANAAGGSSDHTTGPDASGAARHGLCQAWASGQGDDHGRRADAAAFQALADAAGGADQIAAYCAAEVEASADQGQRPAAPPGGGDEHAKASPPTTGPPADPGSGHGQGQGGPPTTA